MFRTADVFDDGPNSRVCETPLRDFGRRKTFWGQIQTIQVDGDHRACIETCFEPGAGRILVIDGGGSLSTALVGATLASLAARSGWSGIIVHGAIRDADELSVLDLGVKAIGTTPRVSQVQAPFKKGVPVGFGGATFSPGDWVYADVDGVLVRATCYEPPPFISPKKNS